MRKAVTLAVVLVASLAVGPVAAAGSTGNSQAASTAEFDESATRQSEAATPTIERSLQLHLTPSEPGRIGVTATYDVPEELTSLRVQLPERATDVTSDSFTPTDDGYEWDGTTDPATLRFTVDANRSSTSVRSVDARRAAIRSAERQEMYSFVDAGSWAVVAVPELGSEWGWRNARDVTLAESVSVAGEGSTGGEVAYLGPVEEHTRTASGQTFTLAVPERASMVESPDDVLDALATASGSLRVGERDDEVWLVAAPTDAPWVARGVEFGGSDLWVVADAPLDRVGNVWLHEYVHTRQAYTGTASGQWTVEAVADYYAALLSLETGYADYDAFETYLGRGTDDPWRDAVLAEPGTWSRGANYVKGSLVWGELDRRVRVQTDGNRTMADVFWRLNQRDEPVSNADVLAAVENVSSPALGDVTERYTTTERVPDMWSRVEHRRAFSTDPARMTYDEPAYRVTGPFRNESFDDLPTLYAGETLTVNVNATNTGGEDGSYAVELMAGGETVAADAGSLAPSESTPVTLAGVVTEPGSYTLSFGRNSEAVTVAAPATPHVSDVSVTRERGQSADQATVTATLASDGDAPASGTVNVSVDGERVGELQASLGAGESVTRTVDVTLSSGDDHTIVVGDERIRVSPTTGSESGTSVPGFGGFHALVALCLAGLLALAAGRER